MRKKNVLIAVIIVLAFSLILPVMALRQASSQQPGQSIGSGLQVSPTRTEISAAPGDRKTFSIVLRNITQSDLTAQVFLNDFQSDNESGTPQIIVDSKERTPYTLANMLKNFNNVDLKAGETKDVRLTIEVPKNAVAGAYFGALRYAAVPKGQVQASDRQVSLTASVAHLVFVEVPGDVNAQIQINSLKAQRGNKPGSFFLNPPNQVSMGVKNLGNGFSRPFGKVSVKNPFGKEVIAYDINNTTPRGIVLPNSSRNFTNQVNGVKLPGKYNMSGSIAYGNGGEVVSYQSSFIYMPWWALLIILMLVSMIGGAIAFAYFHHHNKSPRRRKAKRSRR